MKFASNIATNVARNVAPNVVTNVAINVARNVARSTKTWTLVKREAERSSVIDLVSYVAFLVSAALY